MPWPIFGQSTKPRFGGVFYCPALAISPGMFNHRESTMLKQIYRKALRAGGAAMDRRRAEKLFGGDAKLKKNVFRACREPQYGQAIEKGVINDHRVIEQLQKMGSQATSIMLRVEKKLGRKLVRTRAAEFVRIYARVVRERLALQMASDVIRVASERANSTEMEGVA